jgi:hypothetical protein
MKHKKRLYYVFFGFLFCAMSDCMDIKKKLSFGKKKEKKEDSFVEQIDPNELPLLKDSVVWWKQSDNTFYAVKLGDRIGNTSSYKIYQTENAGIVCSANDLYRYKEQK